jgi:hypothetical protein
MPMRLGLSMEYRSSIVRMQIGHGSGVNAGVDIGVGGSAQGGSPETVQTPTL